MGKTIFNNYHGTVFDRGGFYDGYLADPRYFVLNSKEYKKIMSDEPGGGGGDYSKWEIGDVVLFDSVENKKVKSTKDDFSTEKFPADRFTPIGVVSFVMEDGSARVLALPAMNTNTPDVGSSENQDIYWGNPNLDITGLTSFTKVATIDHITGEVNGYASYSYIPSTGDQFGEVISLDGLRVYYSNSGNFLPSPYKADGSLNSEFFKESISVGPLYCWTRDKDGTAYYMYTDTETPNENTMLWCGTVGNDSQVKNYGAKNKIDEYYVATLLGSIVDETVFDGGVEAFNENFTSVSDSTFEKTYFLGNSDMDGKENCRIILEQQSGEEWKTSETLVNDDSKGNYPIATVTWRFHTPGTEQGDWYCPSAGELAIMISNFSQVQGTLKKVKSSSVVPVACLSTDGSYWSSSEYSSGNAWYGDSGGGGLDNGGKNVNYYVRALCVVPALS